jgi:hypothetical protein
MFAYPIYLKHKTIKKYYLSICCHRNTNKNKIIFIDKLINQSIFNIYFIWFSFRFSPITKTMH